MTTDAIRKRIDEINSDLRYRVNLDTDRAVNLRGELQDLEIKLGILEEIESRDEQFPTDSRESEGLNMSLNY